VTCDVSRVTCDVRRVTCDVQSTMRDICMQIQAAQNLARSDVASAMRITETMMTHLPLREGDACRVKQAHKCLEELKRSGRS
jgi:hypothetical protein